MALDALPPLNTVLILSDGENLKEIMRGMLERFHNSESRSGQGGQCPKSPPLSAYSLPAYHDVWSCRTPRLINNETQRHPGMSRCGNSVLVEATRLRKDPPKSDATDFIKSIESQ